MTVAYNTPQFSVVLLLEVRVKISAQLPSSQGLQMKKSNHGKRAACQQL